MKMNTKEKQISFYNNYFIYKKIRNVDTRAVHNTMIGSSKLQQQMEQLESVEAQNALNNVDKQYFIENKGQWPVEVLYVTRIGGLDAWIKQQVCPACGIYRPHAV